MTKPPEEEQAGCVVNVRSTPPNFLRSVTLSPDAPAEGFPFELEAVRQIGTIEFAPVTVLAGDNGTGKSTIVEALAIVADFNAEGGGRNLRFATQSTHSALHEHLVPQWKKRPSWGWFLRAETFYGMASHIARDPELDEVFPDLHDESHGESFLDLAQERFQRPGFYVLDEPEAALSIQGQMILARLISESTQAGAQFVIATHSPFLMGYPHASIYEMTATGIEPVLFDDLPAVALWRRFLNDPELYYQRLLEDG
jgi:predicted ATPase